MAVHIIDSLQPGVEMVNLVVTHARSPKPLTIISPLHLEVHLTILMVIKCPWKTTDCMLLCVICGSSFPKQRAEQLIPEKKKHKESQEN